MNVVFQHMPNYNPNSPVQDMATELNTLEDVISLSIEALRANKKKIYSTVSSVNTSICKEDRIQPVHQIKSIHFIDLWLILI